MFHGVNYNHTVRSIQDSIKRSNSYFLQKHFGYKK